MKNLDLSTLPAKKRKQIVSCLRAGIQLLYFLFLPSVFTAAFNGVKYIFTQLGQGEKIEMTAFVSALLLVCAFTIVFGRFFCGFACAFGSLGDAMHAIYGIICKKRKKKPRRIKPELAKKLVLIKYGILLLIALCCFAGVYQKARHGRLRPPRQRRHRELPRSYIVLPWCRWSAWSIAPISSAASVPAKSAARSRVSRAFLPSSIWA